MRRRPGARNGRRPAAMSGEQPKGGSTLKAIFPPSGSGPAVRPTSMSSLAVSTRWKRRSRPGSTSRPSRPGSRPTRSSTPGRRSACSASPRIAARDRSTLLAGRRRTPGLADAIASDAAKRRGARRPRRALDTRTGGRSAACSAPADRADAAVVFNAATIVFREGLEAVLILASLMASMIGANRRFKKPLVVGAMGALWPRRRSSSSPGRVLLSLSQYGEKVEAIVSLVGDRRPAAGDELVLPQGLLDAVDRQAPHRAAGCSSAARPVRSSGWSLLGFTSVFREGAETVLFLQALVLDAGTLVVIEGRCSGWRRRSSSAS